MLRVRTRCSASSSAAARAWSLVEELLAACVEPVDLAPGALGGAGQAVEDLDQVALAQPGVGVVGRGVAHLHDEGEAQDGQEDRHHRLPPRGLGDRAAQPPLLRLVRPRLGLAVLGLAVLGLAGGRRQAWNTCLRIAATLEKIRMPSTTTTPVVSCAPTPSWSPR